MKLTTLLLLLCVSAPDKSFARNLARIAKDAGMRYLVITAKHHVSFAKTPSAVSPRNPRERNTCATDLRALRSDRGAGDEVRPSSSLSNCLSRR